MLLYGGLGLIGPLSLVQTSGFANWGYILFKTIYTGGCAACASALAVWSVFSEYGEGGKYDEALWNGDQGQIRETG